MDIYLYRCFDHRPALLVEAHSDLQNSKNLRIYPCLPKKNKGMHPYHEEGRRESERNVRFSHLHSFPQQ